MKVKIPEHLYQVTRISRLQRDVDFYYFLKTIDTSGFISKSSLVCQVKKQTPISDSSIYRKIKRLIELQWVKKTSNGYRLCTYRFLFERLGLGDRKVYFTELKGRATITSAHIELKKKIQSQAYAALMALSSDRNYQRSFKNTRGKLIERLDQLTQNEVAYMIENNAKSRQCAEYAEISQGSAPSFCNPDITMSYNRIAEFLCLSSSSEAFVLMNTLLENGLVEIERNRLVLIERGLLYKEFCERYERGRFRYISSSCYQLLPNKYFFT